MNEFSSPPTKIPTQKESIWGKSPTELIAQLIEYKEPKFRAQQLVKWIFEDRVFNLDQMSNLPKTLRKKLTDNFDWSLPKTVSCIESEDGTSKLLLEGAKQQFIETVIMRYENRTSLCVSSQVGCRLACSFCQTGKLGFFRNLTAAEIVGQFCIANNIVKKEGRRISHIVFMGMGEPLDNFENVVRAANQFTSTEAFGISPRKVTVSTSGIAKRIPELATRCKVSLAVSLHAARNELRSELMPINRRYNLDILKDSLKTYQKKTGDRITFEYILIKNKTCGRKEAKELVKFLHGLKAKVNLIPFNAHPGLEFQSPTTAEIEDFQSYLSERSIAAPVRYSRGSEVSAACGQLAAKTMEAVNTAPARKNALIPEAEMTLHI